MTVRRFDRGGLSKPVRLDNGWLRIDGYVARPGILEYLREDGTTKREYRPPEEAFREDSLQSFALVPFTNDHPPEGFLTAANTGRYQVGTVGAAERDGDKVRARIMVTDADTVTAIESGKVELSVGYTCDVDETPGISHAGERYDSRQLNVTANHVALVKEGRAGPQFRLRVDSADAVMIASKSDSESALSPAEKHPVKKIRIDGVEVELSETAADLVEKNQATAAQALKAAQDSEQASKARADALETDLKKAQTALAEAPAKFQATAAARFALETQAKSVLGSNMKLDGKADRDVKVEVLTKLDANIKLDGKADAYVDAAFDYQIGKWTAEDPAAEVARATQTRTDSTGGDDMFAAALARVAENLS